MPYYDDYYQDDYYEPPRRRYRRRRRRSGRVALIIFVLVLLLVLFFVWRLTDGFTTFAGPDLKNVQNELTYSLNTLAGEISPDMAVNECGEDYVSQLRELAAEESGLADRLNFIADHIEIYTEEAVKTALQGGEKLDFALLMPFRSADDSGLSAVISVDEGEIPYLIQYDTRWGYHGYGSSVMGITGCGPTCLSMAVIGLTGNASATPARIADYAESSGHYVSGAGTAWTLFDTGAAAFGLRGEAISTNDDDMRARLRDGEMELMFTFDHMRADCIGTDFIHHKFSVKKFKRALSAWQNALAGRAWNALYLENHDHARVISRYGSERYRSESGKALAAAYMLLQGTPFIYQGQEIGMTNLRLPSADMYPDVMTQGNVKLASRWLSPKRVLRLTQDTARDSARTPMQWTGGKTPASLRARPGST